MRLQLDENVDVRVAPQLRLAGHDVTTVQEQGMTSMPDEQVIDACRREGRCLVTCDRDFSNRIKFNPSNYPGIVLIRLPARPKLENWREAMETLIRGLDEEEIQGKLWIIQRGQIRQYQSIEEEQN